MCRVWSVVTNESGNPAQGGKMIEISVQPDISALVRLLDDVQKRQVPFAMAHALTMTAKRVEYEEKREMRDVFDRPTPYTLNSLYTRPATKQHQVAWVYLKYDTSKGTPAEKYLMPQIKGGVRRLKRFERALRSVGAMPDDHFAVPGDGAKLDGYGNMDRGQLVQILSYFRAFPEAGYKANITDRRKAALAKGTKTRRGFAYFVGRPGNGKWPLGIWQRTSFAFGSAIRPIIIFVPTARYEQLFDFNYVAEKTIERDFGPQFRASLANALATARPRA